MSIILLLVSCFALFIGPIVSIAFKDSRQFKKGLDGFILVSLGGLVLVHILPEIIESGGEIAILFVILGLWGPTLGEKIFHNQSDLTHNLTITLGMLGIILHSITDGGAIIISEQSDGLQLAIGVIFHRLPVGLAIWTILRPILGNNKTIFLLIAMGIGTSVGYFGVEHIMPWLSLKNTSYFQAFITGSILHVVLHQPHIEDNKLDSKYASFGSLIGLGILLLIIYTNDEHAHNHNAHTKPDVVEKHEHSYDEHSNLEFHDEHSILDSSHDEHEHNAHAKSDVVEKHEHSHLSSTNEKKDINWSLIASALLIIYIITFIRDRYFKDKILAKKHFFLPFLILETSAITLILLGPTYAILHLLAAASMQYTGFKPQIEPITTEKFIDSTAPWIILISLLGNLFAEIFSGFPYILQSIILILIMFFYKITNLAAVTLMAILIFKGVDPIATSSLFFAQFLYKKHLVSSSTLTKLCGLGVFLIINLYLYIKPTNFIAWQIDYAWIPIICISLIFTRSLFRIGPEMFFQPFWEFKQTKHNHHNHDHGHKH